MYNEKYWKEKEQRRMIRALKIKRPSIFNRIMEAIYAPYNDTKKHINHTRSFKERLIRRNKHRDRMRELN